MERENNKTDFDFSEMSKRKDLIEANEVQRKSSYIISVGLQKKLKMLAAERDVKLNDLLIEAVKDLLRKYGK